MHAYKCIALGVPIENPIMVNGDPRIPKVLNYEKRDRGPHFSMKMGTQGPQFGPFGGSLFSHDTNIIIIILLWYEYAKQLVASYPVSCENS